MCGSVCLGLVKVHGHGDCWEAMHACVEACVFAPYEAVCLVFALSLLLLKHQDPSINDLTSLCFVMQELNRLDHRLVSRHVVCIYVLSSTLMNHLSSLNILRASARVSWFSGFGDHDICARALLFRDLPRLVRRCA